MTFDIVIGNPPYNSDLYIDFVSIGHILAKDCSVWITPAKRKNSMDEKNKKYKNSIVPHISEITFYPDCYDVFAISLVSGITIIKLDKQCTNSTTVENKCIAHSELNSKEIRSIGNNETLYNIGQHIIDKIFACNKKIINIKCNIDKKFLVSINKQLTVSGGGFATREKDDSGHWHVRSDVVGNCSMLVSKSENNIVVVGNPQIIEKIPGFDDTGISIFSSDNYDECKSFYSYIGTKFVKFLLLMSISVQACMGKSETWRFVPEPDAFDHIFTDEELYKKYCLSPEEINIIESIIKERK